MTIQGLIEAVEAGTLQEHAWGGMEWPEGLSWSTVQYAYAGSLDAAKALHDALLPGWWWAVGTCKVSDDARVSPDDDLRAPDGGEWAEYTDIDRRPPGNPARAWLLAILRAQERSEG